MILSRLAEKPPLYHPMERTLVTLSGIMPPGYQADADPNRGADEPTREAGLGFWKAWFEQRYQHKLDLAQVAAPPEHSDEEIHRFLVGDEVKGGSSPRGAAVYETLQCVSCHGGIVTPGRESRIFGPELAGVTRRLTRSDLADAVVYPSKQVADRFKAYEVELIDGTVLSGFITEKTDHGLTLADRERVYQLASSQLKAVVPQASSLMPERLLNRLSWQEIRDLFAFLDK